MWASEHKVKSLQNWLSFYDPAILDAIYLSKTKQIAQTLWFKNLPKSRGDQMFHPLQINTYYKQLGFNMQSQLFFLLSWVENMHGLGTSLSELWSLEIGIIKEANVTRGLWGVLVGLPACECPFITRLVKISRGRELHFPTLLQEASATSLYSAWLHGNCTRAKSPQNGWTGGPWQSR